MASDKQKRFRTHVVKELYETEKDYTSGLEFTVMVSTADTDSLLQDLVAKSNGWPLEAFFEVPCQ